MEEKMEKKPAEPETQDGKPQDSKLQDEDLEKVAGCMRDPIFTEKDLRNY